MSEAIDQIIQKYPVQGASQGDSSGIDAIIQKYPIAAPEHTAGEKAQTTLENFGQMGTAGYLPNIQAAVEPAQTWLTNKVTGQNIQPDSYIQARDANTNRIQNESNEMPGYAIGGQLMGAVASAPLYGRALGMIPGLAATGGAGLLKSTAQAMGGGAIMGGIQNPGDTPGELSSLQVPERFQNAKTGAIVGGIANVASQGIRSASDFILHTPERMKDWADLKAAKSAGMMLKDYRAMNARSPGIDPEARIKQVGQAMIDNGLVKPGYTYDDVADKSLELKQKAGKIIGDVYQTATEQLGQMRPKDLTPEQRMLIKSTSLDTSKWADELSEQFGGVKDMEGKLLKKGDLTGKAGGTAAMNAVQSTLDELSQNGNKANLLKVQEFKSDLDGLINYNKRFDDTPLKNEYLFKVRDFINNKIQSRIDALDTILGSDKLGSLKDANKEYGIWSEVNRISQDRVNREAANRFASLTDTIAGVGGAGAGAVAGAALSHDVKGAMKGGAAGLGLGVVNHLARRYGNPVAVNAANWGADRLNQIPKSVPNTMGLIGGSAASNPALTGSIAARLSNPKKKGLMP